MIRAMTDIVAVIQKCHLSEKDVVRHPLVQEIIKAYARFDEEKEKRNGRANNRKRTE